VECEGVYVDEGIWDVGVELVWLYHAEPWSWFVLEAWLVVEVEACLDDWITSIDARVIEPVVALFVGASADGKDEFYNWMVE